MSDQRFRHAVDRTSPGFRFESVGSLFFGLLPRRSKAQIVLAQLVDPPVRLVPAITTAALTMPVSASALRNRSRRSRVSLSFFTASPPEQP